MVRVISYDAREFFEQRQADAVEKAHSLDVEVQMIVTRVQMGTLLNSVRKSSGDLSKAVQHMEEARELNA